MIAILFSHVHPFLNIHMMLCYGIHIMQYKRNCVTFNQYSTTNGHCNMFLSELGCTSNSINFVSKDTWPSIFQHEVGSYDVII